MTKDIELISLIYLEILLAEYDADIISDWSILESIQFHFQSCETITGTKCQIKFAIWSTLRTEMNDKLSEHLSV